MLVLLMLACLGYWDMPDSGYVRESPDGQYIAGDTYTADCVYTWILRADGARRSLRSERLESVHRNWVVTHHYDCVWGTQSTGVRVWTVEEIFALIVGDFNNDGEVGQDDFGLLQAALGGANAVVDLNRDGKVDQSDVGLFLESKQRKREW